MLTLGLFTIIFSALNLYEVYTGHKSAPVLINQTGIGLNLSQMIDSQAKLTAIPVQTGSIELFSAATVNTSLNLFFYFLLMSFISVCGFKVALLGVQLLRPINIKSSVLS